ncbi:MAG: DUF262 domain-containing protein [Deltaproteobacteria bacterium]|nr:DUF262 domain-containing protein [Deltaproteobacteria bacterium]
MSTLGSMKSRPTASLSMEAGSWDESEQDEESHRSIKGVVSYGADYTVDGLVKRVRQKTFDIPPFQRKQVWSRTQKSRFIESLLLDLPVPGIFVASLPVPGVSLNNRSKYFVIDGQQRLLALQTFCDITMEKRERFRLCGVEKRWKNKYFEDLTIDDQQRLDDAIIHTTIIKQEKSKSTPTNNDAILEIFHRLNTGGNFLSPQEIRVALAFDLAMSKLLEEANEDSTWRGIYGNPNKRMKDRELILRFWALYLQHESYKEPMRVFLNDFYKDASEFEEEKRRNLVKIFSNAIEIIYNGVGEKVFRPDKVINAAVFDSVMVGIAKRLALGEIFNIGEIKSAYEDLLNNKKYQDAYMSRTSRTEKVHTRIRAAIEAFKDIS